MSEVLHIKNMVCDRCITAVRLELEKLHIATESIVLGEVELSLPLETQLKLKLKDNLELIGFELLEDKKNQLVEKVKNIIVDLIHHRSKNLTINLSDYISQEMKMDYSIISKQFSVSEKTTIEKFVIAQKIERVKELISYNELSLSEIADLLYYSSVAHLSAQFKKITGVTTSQYKEENRKDRKSLSDI